MFDCVCIFTTGGVLLWSKALLPNFNLDLINIFIKSMLLDYSRNTRKSFNYQDSLLKWQINQDVKLVFTVVYKEILQLAFVEEFLDLLAKAFIGGVYEKHGLAGCDDVFLKLGGTDFFSQHYEIVYSKWDAIVDAQRRAPTKMRTFAQTNRGKKKGKDKKGGQDQQPKEEDDGVADGPSDNTPSRQSESELLTDDPVMAARRKLMEKGRKKKNGKEDSAQKPKPIVEENQEESKKEMRSWVAVSNKVSKKDLQNINVNTADGASTVDIQAEMEKYLGGDDEVLKGFYESDEEVQFDSINPDSQAQATSKGLFGRLTSAF